MMLRGLISATFTPMTVRNTIALRTIDRFAERLVDHAVNGVFVNGTTGEFASMTVQERISVANRWAKVAGGNLKVIVHVGHTCLKAARDMAKEAQKAGAHAISALPPYYFKPEDMDQLAEFLAAIASAAPKLPFYYYHFPEMSGVAFPMAKFLEVARKRISSLSGVKFAGEDMTDFGRCVDAYGKNVNLLLARDEQLLGGLKVGAHGSIGSCCNFAAEVCLRIISNFRSGELGSAQNLQVRCVEILAVLRRYGLIPAGKATMGLVGCDCGPVRPPFRNLTAEEVDQLAEQLDGMGFAELSRR